MGLFSNDGPKLSGKAGDKLVDARGKPSNLLTVLTV